MDVHQNSVLAAFWLLVGLVSADAMLPAWHNKVIANVTIPNRNDWYTRRWSYLPSNKVIAMSPYDVHIWNLQNVSAGYLWTGYATNTGGNSYAYEATEISNDTFICRLQSNQAGPNSFSSVVNSGTAAVTALGHGCSAVLLVDNGDTFLCGRPDGKIAHLDAKTWAVLRIVAMLMENDALSSQPVHTLDFQDSVPRSLLSISGSVVNIWQWPFTASGRPKFIQSMYFAEPVVGAVLERHGNIIVRSTPSYNQANWMLTPQDAVRLTLYNINSKLRTEILPEITNKRGFSLVGEDMFMVETTTDRLYYLRGGSWQAPIRTLPVLTPGSGCITLDIRVPNTAAVPNAPCATIMDSLATDATPPGFLFKGGIAVPCPAGHICPSANMTDAVPCTIVGTYCMVGSSAAAVCPAGSYCPTPSDILPCKFEEYCPPGSTAPQRMDFMNFTPLITLGALMGAGVLLYLVIRICGTRIRFSRSRQLSKPSPPSPFRRRMMALMSMATQWFSLAYLAVDFASDIANWVSIRNQLCDRAPSSFSAVTDAAAYDQWFTEWGHCQYFCTAAGCTIVIQGPNPTNPQFNDPTPGSRRDLESAVMIVFLIILIINICKEVAKAIAFIVILYRRKKTGKLPTYAQFAARNILTAPLALCCGGNKLLDEIFAGPATDHVKLILLDTWLEDIPQLSVSIQWVITISRAPGWATSFSLLTSAIGILGLIWEMVIKLEQQFLETCMFARIAAEEDDGLVPFQPRPYEYVKPLRQLIAAAQQMATTLELFDKDIHSIDGVKHKVPTANDGNPGDTHSDHAHSAAVKDASVSEAATDPSPHDAAAFADIADGQLASVSRHSIAVISPDPEHQPCDLDTLEVELSRLEAKVAENDRWLSTYMDGASINNDTKSCNESVS